MPRSVRTNFFRAWSRPHPSLEIPGPPVTDRPDMVVTGITMFPAAPVSGDNVTFTATVQNIGLAPTPQGTVVGVLFTVVTVAGVASTTWSDTYTTAIPPGGTVTLTANNGTLQSFWVALQGDQTVTAFVNNNNLFIEATTTNNTLTLPFTVAPASGATAPSAPTLTGTPGNVSVGLSWTVPANNGAVILSYNVYKNSVLLTSVAATSTTYTDTAVINGTTYSYSVSAVNVIGEGSKSFAQAVTPNLLVVPTAPVVGGTVSNGATALTWALPANGGSALTAFHVFRGGSEIQQLGPTAVSYNDVGLTNGTTYSYYVTAQNAIGISAPSNTVTLTPAVVPAAPVLTTVGGPGQVALSWTVPANNGAVITGYNVYRNAVLLVAPTGTGTTYTDLTGTVGTAYNYTVSAINSVGEGPQSAVKAGTASAPTVPAAPVINYVQPGNNSVSLGWTIPAANGSALTSYKVYRNTVFIGTEPFPDSPAFGDGGVTNGTTYSYQVTAVNGVGEGPKSAAVNATPAAVSIPAIPATILDATPASKCFGWAAGIGPANTAVDQVVTWRTQFGMTGTGVSWGSQGFKAYPNATLETQPFYFYYTGTDTSAVPDPLNIAASYSTKFSNEHATLGYGSPSVNGGTYGTLLGTGHGYGPKRLKDLDPTFTTYLTIKQRNTALPPVNPYCGDWWNDAVWTEWVRFFKNFAAGLVLLKMDGFQWDWESGIQGWIPCTSTTRPASPLMGCVIHESDTGLYWRWNGAWVSTNLTELQTLIESRGHQVGQAIYSVYPNCSNIHYGWIPAGSLYDARYANLQGRVYPSGVGAHDWYLYGMMRAQTEVQGTGVMWEWDEEYYRNGGYNGTDDAWSQLCMSMTCSLWSQNLPAATRDWMLSRMGVICVLWYNGGTGATGSGGSWPDIGEGTGAYKQDVHHRRSMAGTRSVYHMGSQNNSNGPDDWPALQTDHTVSSYTYSGTNPPGGHQAGLLAAASTTTQDSTSITVGAIAQSRSGSNVTLTFTAAQPGYGIHHVHWSLFQSNGTVVSSEGEAVLVYVPNASMTTATSNNWNNAFVNCTVTIPNATAGLYVILDVYSTVAQRTSRRVQLT